MTMTLDAKNLSKSFGGVRAIGDVSLQVRTGEVLGLIGANGSGKSTLLRTLAGLQAPDEGQILLRGNEVRLRSALHASSLGIGMVHQEQSLIPNLSVAENIFLDKTVAAKGRGLYRWGSLNAAARVQLAKIEVDIPPGALVESLDFVDRQMVEFAKVMALEETVAEPIVVLFDEPTSMLAAKDVERLFAQIRRLRQRMAAVFVSHRLDEILEISDRVIVMTNGVKVAERDARSTDREELFRLMVGSTKASVAARTPSALAEAPVRFECARLCQENRVRDLSFDIRRGEILGLIGVPGSGAEETLRSIFGVEKRSSGTLALDGAALAPRSPRDAIRAGLGYVPAERKSEGMLKGRTLVQNIVLTFGLEYGKGIFVRQMAETESAVRWLDALKVKRDSNDQMIERLSGGNQQKVVLSKWLMSRRLKLLLLDHPTRGLDPGARQDLFHTVREATKRGLSVLFVADTVEEVLELADTVLVMKDGAVTARYDLNAGAAPTQAEMISHMV